MVLNNYILFIITIYIVSIWNVKKQTVYRMFI